jgi:histone H3/H4
MKATLETIRIAKEAVDKAVDKAVNKLLSEAAEKILKEVYIFCVAKKCNICVM